MRFLSCISLLVLLISSCKFEPNKSNLQIMKEQILRRDLCAERNSFEWMVIDTSMCFVQKTRLNDSSQHYSAYDLGFTDTAFIKEHLHQWTKPIYPEWWYDAQLKAIDASTKDTVEANRLKDEFKAKTFRYWVCLRMQGDSTAVVCEEMTWGNKYTLGEYTAFKRQRNTQNWIAGTPIKDTVAVDSL